MTFFKHGHADLIYVLVVTSSGVFLDNQVIERHLRASERAVWENIRHTDLLILPACVARAAHQVTRQNVLRIQFEEKQLYVKPECLEILYICGNTKTYRLF